MLKVPSPICSHRENLGKMGRALKRVLTLILTGDLSPAPPSDTGLDVGVAHTLWGLAVLANCDTWPDNRSLLLGVTQDMARLPGPGLWLMRARPPGPGDWRLWPLSDLFLVRDWGVLCSLELRPPP